MQPNPFTDSAAKVRGFFYSIKAKTIAFSIKPTENTIVPYNAPIYASLKRIKL